MAAPKKRSGVVGTRSMKGSQGTWLTGTFEPTRATLNASDPKAIDQLRTMAQQGKIPQKITGSREDQARLYEEFDRVYGELPGVMNEYHTDGSGHRLNIHFDNDFTRGEDTDTYIPHGNRASISEKNGAIKHAIYSHRGALELSALCRRGGFATYEMSQKWGGRSLSDAEKAQVTREMEARILELFKSPLSESGRQANESHWWRDSVGWRRVL